MRDKTYFCIQQKKDDQSGKSFDMYLYDDITKYGSFDWSTWEFQESKTSADYFRQQLEEIPEDAEINLYINSDGGDVYEATAIYNQLKRHKGRITAIVDGRAHSAAFTVLQAADHRVMNLGTTAIIHNMWMIAAGNAKELRKAADDLDVMMDACVGLLMERALNITEEELRLMLDEETILTPETALKYGFIDEIFERSEEAEPEEEPNEKEKEIKKLRNEVNNLRQEIEERFKMKVKEELIEQVKQTKKDDIKTGFGFDAFFNA